MDPAVPFAPAYADASNAEPNRDRLGDPLPYAAPPEGMFPDVRASWIGTALTSLRCRFALESASLSRVIHG